MRKTKKRLLAMALTLIMVLSMVPTAFAASHAISVTYADGSHETITTSREFELHTDGLQKVQSININSGSSAIATYTNFSSTIQGTISSGGTSYLIVPSTDANGRQVLTFRLATELKDSFSIVVNGITSTYTVEANSGAYGQGSNQGGTPTCSVTHTTKSLPEGGSYSYTNTFIPYNGQDIVKLNIRTAGGESKLVDAADGEVTVGGQKFTIFSNSDGSVSITSNSVTRDMFITALTQDEGSVHSLTVTTDGTCTSSITSERVTNGTSKVIILTPTNDWNVGDIRITANGKTEILDAQSTSVTVDGKRYVAERKLDGSVELSVPAMTTDVVVYTETSYDDYLISVDSGPDAISYDEGINYVRGDQRFSVTFRPDDGAGIMRIKVETANGTYYADATDPYIKVEGYYNQIVMDYDGDVTIYFDGFPGNMIVTAVARDYSHDIDIDTAAGITASWYSDEVDDGDDVAVKFTPKNSSYEVKQLRITVNGSTYTVNPSTSTYVRVNDTRWPVDMSSSGVVTLEMIDIEDDVKVYASSASSSASSSGKTYRITVNEDTHSNVDYTGVNPFYVDENPTITVKTDSNYIVNYVRFNMDGKSVNVEPFDTSFVLDGETYYVDWVTNREFSVDFHTFTNNLTVSAYAERGTERDWTGSTSGGRYTITKTEDARSNVTWTGSNPFYSGEDTTVTVTTDANYIIDTVKFTMGGKSVTIEPFDTWFLLDGKVYTVDWDSNRDFSVFFDTLTGNLSINAKSIRGSEKDYEGGSYDINISTGGKNGAYMYGYSNGNFGPDNQMTRGEAVVILWRLFGGLEAPDGYKPYADVGVGDWYYEEIASAQISGYLAPIDKGDTNFRPNQSVTRAELLAMLMEFANVDMSGISMEPAFYDVPYGHWASGYISYGKAMGWARGYHNGSFQPDKTITRAEVVTMINRILGRTANRYGDYTNYFYDVPSSYWAYYDIMEATTSRY